MTLKMSFNFSRISRGNCTTKTKSVRKLLNSPFRPRDERFGFRRFLDHLAKKKVKLAKLQKHTHFGNHRRNVCRFPRGQQGGHVRGMCEMPRGNGGGAAGELIWMKPKTWNQHKKKLKRQIENLTENQGKCGTISAKNGEIQHAHTFGWRRNCKGFGSKRTHSDNSCCE